MIKSLSLVLLLVCFCKAAAFSAPAYPKARKVVQPDGTTITIQAHGDEFCHYLTTEDGTVVAKGADGFYRPTGQDAKKLAKARTTRGLIPMQAKAQNLAGRNFRGLVLLVNFNDRKFSRGDEQAHTFYDRMMNEENFTSDNDAVYGPQKYTGSVRDYYSDNSYGQFAPEFDVVGPIDMDVSQYYINGVTNTYELMKRVLTKADEEVDFTKYDADGDGVLDMVYVIYAGYASHYDGNDERLIWPHAGSMGDEYGDKVPSFDGIKAGRFACSAEIYGWEEDEDEILDGIGVIVHEFSHVLGYMDHYDTSGGWQEHPNAWDIMSAGCYSENFNRTPCGFNSYEKAVAGFITPLDITEMAGESVSMESTTKSTDACLLRSYQEHVSFFMENRQKEKWDKYLPGHGMLVWRVDSIRPEYWEYNAVNVTTRACFRLVRACGTQGSWLTGVEDVDYDPFPGTKNVTELDNDNDAANLISYDQYPCPVVLRSITEKNKVISFNVEYDEYAKNQPITYAFPTKFYARAEKQEGEEWVPMTWEVTPDMIGEQGILRNILPNTEDITDTERDYSNGVFVNYTTIEDGNHTVQVTAQRLSLNSEYGTWICNFTDVDQSGAGTMVMTLDRYGIPSFVDPDIQIGFVTMKTKAYLVSAKNIIERIAVYRNVEFSSEEFDLTGIENVHDNRASQINNVSPLIYNLQGQRVETPIPGNIYIIGGRKVFVTE